MINRSLCVLLSVIALIAPVLADQPQPAATAVPAVKLLLNGTWWLSLSRREQIAAVGGLLSGYQTGRDDAARSMNSPVTEAQLDKNGHDALSVAPMLPFDVRYPLETIADRLNTLYRDHPRLRSGLVGAFIRCAATLPEGCEPQAQRIEKLFDRPRQ